MDEVQELIERLRSVEHADVSQKYLMLEAAEALTVSPEKLEAAAGSIAAYLREHTRFGHTLDTNALARAAAIALGLKVE